MIEEFSAGCDTGSSKDRGQEKNPQDDLVLRLLKPPRDAHSKKFIYLNMIARDARGLLAAGMRVSENDLFERASENRYRAGEVVRAMRYVHQIFPKHTRLYLEGGIWYLSPEIPEVQGP